MFVSVHKRLLVYLHCVQCASAGDDVWTKLSFPMDFYRSECAGFIFTIVLNCHLSIVFHQM